MSIDTNNTWTDPFYWKGITLYQDHRVLKIGTDALLLATWVPNIIHKPNYILDVGTGSGVLAVLMAHAYPQSAVYAIDPDENAVLLARHNAGLCHMNHSIRVDQTDLLEYAASTDQRFDLILSNPPYYVNHILPASAYMQSAKHATASPARWMFSLEQLITSHGIICIVVPTLVAFEWIKEANANQMYCNHRMDVYSFRVDKQTKRSLLCFSHALRKPQHEKLVMYEYEKIYTSEYVAWLGL